VKHIYSVYDLLMKWNFLWWNAIPFLMSPFVGSFGGGSQVATGVGCGCRCTTIGP